MRGAIGLEVYNSRTHWLSRDGSFKLPGEMDTGHLVNSLRMVLRKRKLFSGDRLLLRELAMLQLFHPLIADMARVLDRRSDAWRTWL